MDNFKPRYVTIKFKHHVYQISTIISVFHHNDFLKMCKDDNVSDKECVLFLLNLLMRKKDGEAEFDIPIKEKLSEIEPKELETFLKGILSDDEKLNQYYQKQDHTHPLYHCFRQAYIQYAEEYIKQILKKFSENQDRFKSALQLKPINLTPVVNTIQQSINAASQAAMGAMHSVVGAAFEVINSLSNRLIDLTRQLGLMFPIDEWYDITERKKELSVWANYGWTYFTDSYDIWQAPPTSQQEADKRILRYLSTKRTNDLLEALMNDNKKAFIDEAINCYMNRNYHASAMITVALIEKEILKIQKDSLNDICVGRIGVKRFSRHMNHQIDNEKYPLDYLIFSSTNALLYRLFEPTQNFSISPYNINRNLLMHGQMKKKALQRDCKKLFAALSNVNYLCKFYK